MTLYAKGTRLEHMALHELEREGYHVIRSSISRSPFDLVASNATDARWIQIKSGGRKLSNIATIKSHVKSDVKDFPIPEGFGKELWIRFAHQWLKWTLVDGVKGPEWQPMTEVSA